MFAPQGQREPLIFFYMSLNFIQVDDNVFSRYNIQI